MSENDKYRGILPAFFACYDDEGNISPERVEKLAKYYLDIGVKGLYVGGSSGECIYQTVEERKLVLKHVMEAVGGEMTIIAHIAAPSTSASIELAQHAEKLGVDALAAIPPIYYPLPEHAIEKYWTDIVRSTELDFFIYNIPSTTGYSLSTELFQKMLSHPQVIGVKNSSAPVQDIYLLRAAQTRDTIIFNGVDEQYLGGRIMGADGGIGSTYGVMPKLYIELDKAYVEQDIHLAQAIQEDINEIIFKILNCDGNLYDIMKKVLEDKEDLHLGHVRPPLPIASVEDMIIIDEISILISEAEEKYCSK